MSLRKAIGWAASACVLTACPADGSSDASDDTSATSTTTQSSSSVSTSSTTSTSTGQTSMVETSGSNTTGVDDSTTGGPQGSMQIYWVDTEGGAATLIVTPDGELVLVDAGNPGDRDPDRIAAVVTEEIGAPQIDLCIVTHYDGDHVGGVPGVDERVPIAAFWDHGDSVQAGGGGGQVLWEDYLSVATGKRTVVAPGDVYDVGGLQFQIVSAHGETLAEPLPDGGLLNAACDGAMNMPVETNENAMSVGFVASWHDFDFLDLGDLTWSYEHDLACPMNLIGHVDLYQTTHHGLTLSGAVQMVHGVDPIVAVMNNGPHKGGAPETFDWVTSAPSQPDLWQIHRALDTDDAHNSPDEVIANLAEGDADMAHFVHAHIDASGLITLTNGRTGDQRTYASR